MKTLTRARNRIKRHISYQGQRYHYLKSRGICVCCGDTPAAYRIVQDDMGKVTEKRRMVKCWPCTEVFRAYQKARV